MQLVYIVVLFILASPAQSQCIDHVIEVKNSQWRDADSAPILERLKRHSGLASKITIHYTGVKKNPNLPIERKLKGLFRFSAHELTEFKKVLWGDIPYHFYIDAHGKAAEARSPEYQPDTNTKYDPDGHLTVVVEGTLGDNLSQPQRAKLFAVIKALQNEYEIPTTAIDVHRHYARTSCPGPEVEAAVRAYKKEEVDYLPNPKACSRH